MSLSNPNKPVTEERLQEFYHKIAPYMGNSGGGTGGGHTIEDSEGTELTQRDTLQFGDGLNVSDDSTNGKTVVEPNLMVASDMDDVVTPLPSTRSGYTKYSTTEQVVGEWINGDKVYQKSVELTSPTVVTDGTPVTGDSVTISNVKKVVSCDFIFDVTVAPGAFMGGGKQLLLTNSFQYGIKAVISCASESNIQVACVSSFSTFNGLPIIATLQYTKTT